MIQSVDRALQLLEEVAAHGDWVGVRELARATGLNPPTAQNLLKTLQARGFLEFDEQMRRYRVGLAALRLADSADSLARMGDFARPFVQELFSEFDETVAVLALIQGQAVVVDWRQANHSLAVTHHRRVIEFPHFMASGQVLLAFQDETFREGYLSTVDYGDTGLNMPTNRDELAAVLTKTREYGMAETENMRGCGIAAVAAPVLDATGRIVMAMACSAPLTRADASRRKDMRKRVVETALRMTCKLGGREP